MFYVSKRAISAAGLSINQNRSFTYIANGSISSPAKYGWAFNTIELHPFEDDEILKFKSGNADYTRELFSEHEVPYMEF